MKRYVAALLVVVGLVGLVGVLAVGIGFADEENASRAKCSKATLHGTYLLAYDGVDVKGKDQGPFALAGYDVFDGNGHLKTDYPHLTPLEFYVSAASGCFYYIFVLEPGGSSLFCHERKFT